MEGISAQELRAWASEARERWAVPGIAVGVVRHADTVTAADGVIELGHRDPVLTETLFRIASITKPFVATLALTLVQEGLLALDEPPPGTRVRATVRQLLSHHGGLAHEWPTPLEEDDDDDALIRLAEGEPELLPVGPGELFSYANTGFWLVGAASARASGTSFEEAMRTRVLEPLGLRATAFTATGAARGHNQIEPGADEHRPVEDRYPRVRRPSGGVWSSVDELLRFGAHHLVGPGPLTPDSIAEMQRPHAPLAGGASGLGWLLSGTRGRPTVEHTGSAAGYQSLLVLVPDDQLAFVGLTNSSRGGAAIRDVLAHLDLAPVAVPDAPLAPDRLAAFAGRYAGQGIELEFVPEDGHLRVELAEFDPFRGETQQYPSVRARPVGEREFEIVDGEWRGERFDFPRDGFVCMGTLAARIE
jgi:CubicO group peptidase (beta-lactamase class C family)